LGGWYRKEFTSLLKEDKTVIEELFAPLGGAGNAPRKPQLLQFYQTQHYEERVKERAEERLKALRRSAEVAGRPYPHAITVQNEMTKECWAEEPESFRQIVMRNLERHHESTVKAWKEAHSDGPSRTAEEYSA
jgi:hypothetical protein